MRAWSRLLAAGLLLTLLASPWASAAPATAQLRVQAPLALAGDVALAADQGVVVLPALRALAGSAAHLNITLHRLDGAAGHGPPERAAPAAPLDPAPPALPGLPAPPVPGIPELALGPREPGVRYLEMADFESLTFQVHQARARAWLAVGSYDLGTLRLASPAVRVEEVQGTGQARVPEPFALPARPWVAAGGSGALEARGTVRGLLEGVSVVVQNATAALQVDTTVTGAGPRWVAVLRWTDARLDAASPEAFRLQAPLLRVDLQGTLEAPRAWGGVAVDRQEGSEAAGRALRAEGAMQGELAPGGGAMALRAQGDLAYLALGDDRRDFAQAAAAGAGLAIASALAWRFLAVPLYARIAPNDLLDNDVRRRVHEHVARNPGADVKGSAQAVGVSWSTAAYHLARLEREGILFSRRAGRSKRFFLNGGAASGREEAIGALRNPTSLAIAELVGRQPGLMQKEIGAALGLPASTVSWHMRRLRALGVVREERRWRRAEYAPGPVWGEVVPALREAMAGTPAPAAPASAADPAALHLPPARGPDVPAA